MPNYGNGAPMDEATAKRKAEADAFFAAIDLAKKQAASGNTLGASQALSQAGGMSGTQAFENLTAQQKGRSAVNMAAQNGQWSGTVSKGNPAGADTAVINSMSTAPQKAATTQQTATTQAAYQQAQATAQKPTTTTTQAPPTPAPAAGPAQFQPASSGYQLTPEQSLALAQQRAALAADYKKDAINQGLNRAMQGFDQSAQAVNRQLNQSLATNDEEAARAGFFTSGRRFALRDNSNGQAVTAISNIEAQRNLAGQEARDQLTGVARDQGNMVADMVDTMRRDNRDYALRERGQTFSEFSDQRNFDQRSTESNRDYGLRKADLESTLAGRNFDLSRNQQLLPYQLQGADLANQNAQFGLDRGRTMLPGELAGMDLTNQGRSIGNKTAEAQYSDTYGQGGLGFQLRQAQLQGSQLQNQGAQLQNKQAQVQFNDTWNPGGVGYQLRQGQVPLQQAQIAASQIQNQMQQFEYTLATDPSVGKRAQAAAALDQARAQLDQIKAQTYRTYNPVATSSAATTKASQDATLFQKQFGNMDTGWTKNVNALGSELTDLAIRAQRGQINYVEDVAKLLDNPQTVQKLSAQGVDPQAVLNWAVMNLGGRDPNLDRILSER